MRKELIKQVIKIAREHEKDVKTLDSAIIVILGYNCLEYKHLKMTKEELLDLKYPLVNINLFFSV